MKDHFHHWDHHVIGPVQTNCYIVSQAQGKAVLFDPGGPEAVGIVHDLQENGVEITHVLVTHGHFDHLGWATEVKKAVEGAKVYLHEAEKEAYEPFQDWMSRLGFDVELREPDVWVKEGDVVDAAGMRFKVMHTPGHSPGSAIYQLDEHAFVGDLIFRQSIGRTDLPFSNPQDMEKSLRRIMVELDPSTHLLPGHGDLTTMAEELTSNMFLRSLDLRGSLF